MLEGRPRRVAEDAYRVLEGIVPVLRLTKRHRWRGRRRTRREKRERVWRGLLAQEGSSSCAGTKGVEVSLEEHMMMLPIYLLRREDC